MEKKAKKDPKAPVAPMRMSTENAKKRAAKIKQEAMARALRRLGRGFDV
jgi:hypothetical protein